MAINNAVRKAKKNEKGNTAKTSSQSKGSVEARKVKSAPLAGFEERAATLRLYVKDKDLLKKAKLAALEDDTSLSQLWEDWALEWLRTRK
mgnify:FL=1|jgi:hypothetical protein